MPSKRYTEQDIINNAKEVGSMAALLRSLGLKSAGGNHANMQRILDRLEVDTSHWHRQLWSKGKFLKCKDTYISTDSLKKFLTNERGNKCEMCNLSTWQGMPIILELHHIDGNRFNNVADNAQLLCPNCHSLTDNWRNRKRE
jgi:RNA polymerase subunit RPABC4/transcription elongation factor Spt4